MIAQSKRLFPRHGCRLSIHYRTHNRAPYRKAVALNCSRAGMYFEPKTLLMPEEPIQIVMDTDSSVAKNIQEFSYYQAQTVWSRSIADDANPRYGCGARLIKRGCRSDGRNAEVICHTCDICGAQIPCYDLRKTEEFLVLCPSCEWRLVAAPEGPLKNSLKQFYIGNVI